MATSSMIQMKITLYMFLAQFLVEKRYFSHALGFFFSREMRASNELTLKNAAKLI